MKKMWNDNLLSDVLGGGVVRSCLFRVWIKLAVDSNI